MCTLVRSHQCALLCIYQTHHNGHLVGSGSLPQVKIWDVFNGGKCMRTYLGHSKVGGEGR